MESPAPSSLDPLLSHAHFVRQLARSLVRDEAEREDLVQETWLAAIQNPPTKSDGVRSWLRVVIRNFAQGQRRSERRRGARELRVARSEALPSTVDLVAREAVLRLVSKSVLALEKSHREVILFRFYEDLPPREIARRLGLPVATVNSRLQRALRALRGRLDAASGGQRQAWCLPLAALVGIRGPLLRTAGRGAVSAAWAGAGVVLLLGLAGVWLLGGPTSPSTRLEVEWGPRASAAFGDEVRSDPVVTRRLPPATLPPAPESLGRVRLSGRVLDERRFPVAGIPVLLNAPTRATMTTSTDAGGRFAFRLHLGPLDHPLDVGLWARGAEGRVALRSQRIWEAEDCALGDLILEPGFELRLGIRDGETPAARARVHVRVCDHRLFRLSTRETRSVYLGEFATDAKGLLQLEGLPRGAIVLSAYGAAERQARSVVEVGAGVAERVTMRMRPGRDVQVLVRDRESGFPQPAERLVVWERIAGTLVPYDLRRTPAPSDAEGRTWLRGASVDSELSLTTRSQVLARETESKFLATLSPAETSLELVAPASRDLKWPLSPKTDDPHPGTRFIVRFLKDKGVHGGVFTGVCRDGFFFVAGVPEGARSGIASGAGGSLVARFRVPQRDHDGQPILFQPGAQLDLRLSGEDPSVLAHLPLLVEDGGDGFPRQREVETDERGRCRISGLFPGQVRVSVLRRNPIGPQRLKLGEMRVPSPERGSILRLRGARRYRVLITVGGQPRLPANYSLLIGGGALAHVQEDPASGILEFVAWPFDPSRNEVGIGVLADGVDARLVPLRLDQPAPVVQPLALVPQPSVSVEVLPPSDGDYALARMDWRRERWRLMPEACVRSVGSSRFEVASLPPGFFRVIDRASGACSPAFESRGAGLPRKVVLDLRSVGWVEGRVQVPRGQKPSDARVRVLPSGLGLAPPPERKRPQLGGDPSLAQLFTRIATNFATTAKDWEWSGTWVPVDETGRFRVRIPGDRRVEIQVSHPRCKQRTPCRILEPRAGVEITMDPLPGAVGGERGAGHAIGRRRAEAKR